MNVVVTGGSGKAGRPLVEELASGAGGKARHDVLVLDKAPISEGEGVRYLAGDVEDLGCVRAALSGADAVIHLAGIHTHGILPNEDTFRINATGTFNVHEAAWRLGIPRVVTMSSEAVLGWAPGSWEREHVPDYLPIDEDHPVGAQDAYGLSKVVSEAIARSYTAKCGMETVILRPPWIVSPKELETSPRVRRCNACKIRPLPLHRRPRSRCGMPGDDRAADGREPIRCSSDPVKPPSRSRYARSIPG